MKVNLLLHSQAWAKLIWRMRVRSLTIAITALLCGSETVHAGGLAAAPQNKATIRSSGISIEPSWRIRGRKFAWDHEIRVALPASYAVSKRSYPVLWATDGAMDQALSVIEAAGKSLPEMIVVSVGVPEAERSQFQQRRDWEFSPLEGRSVVGYAFSGPGSDLFRSWAAEYDQRKAAKGDPEQELGGAPIFLDFIVDELGPALGAKYRVTAETILWGHSGGGMFCVFAVLTRPGAFRNYICGSPSLNASDFAIFKMEDRFAKAGRDLPVSLFLGVGEDEALQGEGISEWGVASSTVRFAEILRIRNYHSLHLGFRILPGDTHGEAWTGVLDSGLRWLFPASKKPTDRTRRLRLR